MGVDLARHGMRTVTTGVVGVAIVECVKRFVRAGAPRAAAVTMTSWGLRGRRVAETAAEGARLAAADVLAEARERVGEQAPPPGSESASHQH